MSNEASSVLKDIPEKGFENPSMYLAWNSVRTRFGDQDPNQHINNVAVCQYFEEARFHIRRKVFPDNALSAELDSADKQFVAASLCVKFLRPMAHPSTLQVGSFVSRIGSSSYTTIHGLFDEDVCMALCRCVMVVCNLQGRPVPIPDFAKETLTGMSHISIDVDDLTSVF